MTASGGKGERRHIGENQNEPRGASRGEPIRQDPSSRQDCECKLLVGTCGYAYPEWNEAGIYPKGTPSGKMLPLYARRFSITELNHTWYQMPRAEAMERMSRAVPPGFLFTAKVTRTLTHEVDPKEWPRQAQAFRDGVAPLVQAGQLAAALIQLPPGFDRCNRHRFYLAALLESLDGLPLAVEFRNNTWAEPRVFDELAKRQVTLVAVDEPNLPGLFPPLDVVTNPELIYVRFHGRNTKGWRSGSKAIQFDYQYSDQELREWVEGPILSMSQRARQGVFFFNNHVRGQAPNDGTRLESILRESGFQVSAPMNRCIEEAPLASIVE